MSILLYKQSSAGENLIMKSKEILNSEISCILQKFLVPVLLVFLLFSSIVFAQDTKEEAENAIAKAEQEMQVMYDGGFAVNAVNDTIYQAKQAMERAEFAESIGMDPSSNLAQQAKKAFEGLNYEGFTYEEVIKIADKVPAMKQQAYGTFDEISVVKQKIPQYKEEGVYTADAENMLKQAEEAFEKERYAEAEELVAKSTQELDARKAELTTVNVLVESSRGFLERNWKNLAITAFVLIVVIALTWHKVNLKRIQMRLKSLYFEREALIRLIKDNQIDMYKKGTIASSVYKIRMEKYNERLNQIKEQIPVVEEMLKKHKVKKIKPPKGRKVKEEKQEEVKPVQKKARTRQPQEPLNQKITNLITQLKENLLPKQQVKPIKQQTKQPTTQSTPQPTKPIKQPIKQPFKHPIEKPAKKPAKQFPFDDLRRTLTKHANQVSKSTTKISKQLYRETSKQINKNFKFAAKGISSRYAKLTGEKKPAKMSKEEQRRAEQQKRITEEKTRKQEELRRKEEERRRKEDERRRSREQKRRKAEEEKRKKEELRKKKEQEKKKAKEKKKKKKPKKPLIDDTFFEDMIFNIRLAWLKLKLRQ